MYICKRLTLSAASIFVAEGLFIVLSIGLNSRNHEKLVKGLYPCPDIRHFMIVIKRLLLSDIKIKH